VKEKITNIPDCISKINNIKSWMKNYVMPDHPIIKDAEDIVKFLSSNPKLPNLTVISLNHRITSEFKNIELEQQKLSDNVLSAVSHVVRLPVNDILKKSRYDDIVEARFIYFWIVRKKYMFSFHLIGRFVNKDHATVLYGVNKAEEWMVTRKGFKERVAKCINKLENELQ